MDGKVLSGQIDRLYIAEDAIWIIDYKTNRPSPKKPEDIPDIYIKQMRAYANALQNIYPNRTVKAFLLWTDGPNLMALENL
jgi:ATP-dependent helicase/nuclease subunit A